MRSFFPRGLRRDSILQNAKGLLLALCLVCVQPRPIGAAFDPVPMDDAWTTERFHIASMLEFNGRLYAGTQRRRNLKAVPPEPGGLEVLCIYREGGAWKWHEACPQGFESGNGLGWQNFSVTGMHLFQDRLYVGTWNVDTGAQLWRTRSGVTHPQGLEDWERVDPGSFSGYAVTSMVTFEDQLYAGIFAQGFPIPNPACGVWKSPDGVAWAKVNLNGFLDPFNSDATTLAVHQGFLYAGTENGYFYSNLRVGTGAEVWRSSGGDPPGAFFSWKQVNTDGFGRTGSNVFNRNALMMISYDGFLYVGTENYYTGAELWRYDGAGWNQVLVAGDPTRSSRNTLSITYHSAAVFEGDLYLCTTNPFTGGEVWRYDRDRWSRANEPGFGDGHGIAAAPVVYEDQLVVVGDGGPLGAVLYSMPPPSAGDIDADGVPDAYDNCPYRSNALQVDEDQNGIGDDCQDEDGDGVPRDQDCDDQEPSVHPGASDPFSDGIDWDCNGADAGDWEWYDDGADSNGNRFDNCGTIPVDGPVRGLFAFSLPWVVFFLLYFLLRRRYV